MSKRWSLFLGVALSIALLIPLGAAAQTPEQPSGTLRLVGHNPLMNRGMNAAIAIHGDYAYIGSRTDGHPEDEYASGIFIVDISDPANPTTVGRMGPPDTANQGESSRELRIWQSQDILIVLHTNCGGAGAHNCTTPSRNNFRFFDISGDNATDPELITTFNQATHEFYLWEDPDDPERALIFAGSAGSNTTAFSVWDISPVLDGEQPITLLRSRHGYTNPSGGLHSLSISTDGTRAFFALLTGGFAVADTSDFAAGVEDPELRPITINQNRPIWDGPGAHSALKLWNRDWAYVSDEVYGTATGSDHGCPWGWARLIDISDPTTPTVEGEYKLPQNLEEDCDIWEPRPRTSYSAHNPTHTPNVVLTTWHSGGLQLIDVSDPSSPTQLAEYFPDPPDEVQMEDPRLSSDPDTGRNEKVVMWSYPIIKGGLIYVVDLRNGLYVLDYDGPYEDEIEAIGFLEGNSNLGHALCYEPVGERPDYCTSFWMSGYELDLLVADGGITEGLEGKVRNALEKAEEWLTMPKKGNVALSHLERAIHLLLWQADVIENKNKPNQGDAERLRELADSIARLLASLRG